MDAGGVVLEEAEFVVLHLCRPNASSRELLPAVHCAAILGAPRCYRQRPPLPEAAFATLSFQSCYQQKVDLLS